jgi:hypothetical protein
VIQVLNSRSAGAGEANEEASDDKAAEDVGEGVGQRVGKRVGEEAGEDAIEEAVEEVSNLEKEPSPEDPMKLNFKYNPVLFTISGTGASAICPRTDTRPRQRSF